MLVYRQKEGKVTVAADNKQSECDSTLTERRGLTEAAFADLLDAYKLEAVAGLPFRVTYSGADTDAMVCWFTECLGEDFPATIADINEGDSCDAHSSN